jgi:predicted MFS family arabinose efflux permease
MDIRQPVDTAQQPADTPLSWPLVVFFTAARVVLNTAYRMVYPFLPVLARGLGVDISAIEWLIRARSGAGLIAPLAGTLADVWGRKATMLLGLALYTGGLTIAIFWPTYPGLFAAIMLSGIGKFIFDPVTQTYIGDRVDYARRGLMMSIVEFGWSAAFIVGVPLIGWLIGRAGWRAPYPWLALLGLASFVWLWRSLPNDRPQAPTRPKALHNVRTVLAQPAALGGLGVGLLISLANESLQIVYGQWMEGNFGLTVEALGASTIVIGLAELTAEGLVAGLVDRLGKRRAVGLGATLNIIACLGLPFTKFNLGAALVGYFAFFITFEFALVSSFPLLSELAPKARATLMSVNFAALTLGRVLGSIVGPGLFPLGLLAVGASAALANALALVLLIGFVRVDGE